MQQDWKDNPDLSGIDPNKLSLLQQLAEQGQNKNMQEMLPFLMNAATQGKNSGLNFSQSEISAILQVLKMGKSPEECAKVDKIVSILKMIR